MEKLKSQDKQLVNDFKKKKIELDAKKNWDLFYRRNKANFFKDRYWTFREFDELNEDFEDLTTPESDGVRDDQASANNKKIKTLLEIGCGVGNFMYPLLKNNKNFFIYACDFSTDAIQLLKSNADYDETRCFGFVCDVTKENSLRDMLPSNVKLDLVTLIFVLSALHPDKMRIAVKNIASVGLQQALKT